MKPSLSLFTSFKRRCLLFVAVSAFVSIPVVADLQTLPDRARPIPKTTDGVPHIQIGVEAVPKISKLLLDRVAKIPGVELRNTVVGRTGSAGFWLSEDIKVARPDVIVRGREFAHMHPDGSLHASLPLNLAIKAVQAGWATHHPWANQRQGWEGFVMLYTPVTKTELEVVMTLVMESYRFVTGNKSI